MSARCSRDVLAFVARLSGAVLLVAAGACAQPVRAPSAGGDDVDASPAQPPRPRRPTAADAQSTTAADLATPAGTVDAAAPDGAGDVSGRDVTANDAPPAGDGGGTGSLGGPAPPCRFRFCESFETAADGTSPDPAIWRRSSNAVVVEGLAARGTKALRVRTPAAPTESYISTDRAVPAGTKAFYGRVFFNIQQRPADFYHWNLVELKGPDARGIGLRYGGVSTGTCAPGTFCYNTILFQVKPQVYGGSEGATDQDELKQVVKDKVWTCLEWFVDATARESRVWLNGMERPRLHYQNASPEIAFPEFARLYLGWGLYQTGKSGVGWEVLIDELVTHDQRIGCGP